MSSTPANPFQYHRWLDGFRGVAILAVLACHLGFLPAGYLGVDLFFGLSGFLITALLVGEYQRTGTVRLGRFYARRALRLLPAFAFTLVGVYAVVRIAFPDQARAVVKEGVVAACYLMNWPTLHKTAVLWFMHTWSLASEEQFYLLWPPLLVLLLRAGVGRRWVIALVVAGIAAAAGHRAWMVLHPPVEEARRLMLPYRIYHGLDTRADALLTGCLVGLLSAWGYLPRAGWPRVLTGTVGAAAAVGLGLFLWRCPSPYASPVMFLWLYAVIALTIGAFLYAMLAAPVPGLRHALEFAPLVGLGRISYGVYLIHFPVILFLARTGRNPFSNRGALIALGATLAIALLSYFLLERPCLRLKARFAAARAPAPATDAPAEPARRAA